VDFVFSLPDTASGSSTVTVSGGKTPYSYEWTRLNGVYGLGSDPGNSATINASKYIEVSSFFEELWQCRVTDDNDATTTVLVPILLASG
jgi:hypothetical protein